MNILFIGDVGSDFRDREAFQEIDQVATIGGLAKWAAEPPSAAGTPEVLREALRQAMGGRPGPVLLSLAEDLLDELAPDDAQVAAERPGTARPTDREIGAVIELLASAERPVILAGGGVLRARTSTDLLRFGQLLLQKGRSGTQQVVPESWIDAGTAPQFTATNGLSPRALNW